MKLKKHKRRLLLINAILIFICAGLITRDSNEDPEMDLPAIHMSLNDCTLEEIHDGATGIPYEGNTLDLDGKEYTNVRVKGRGNSSWKMPGEVIRSSFTIATLCLVCPRQRNGFSSPIMPTPP